MLIYDAFTWIGMVIGSLFYVYNTKYFEWEWPFVILPIGESIGLFVKECIFLTALSLSFKFGHIEYEGKCSICDKWLKQKFLKFEKKICQNIIQDL